MPIRRDAYRNLLEDNITLKETLTKSCKDTFLRDVRFVAPATLVAAEMVQASSTGLGAKRDRTPNGSSPMKFKGGKGNKGKGGQGDGGKGGKAKQFSARELNPQKLKLKSNGRNICSRYNNKAETCNGACGMRQEPTPGGVVFLPIVGNNGGVVSRATAAVASKTTPLEPRTQQTNQSSLLKIMCLCSARKQRAHVGHFLRDLLRGSEQHNVVLLGYLFVE
eukprot:4746515-Karenia_brevis.AAC.1